MGDSGAQSSQPASGAPSSGGAGWRQWAKSGALLLVAAVSLYLLLPTLLSVFGSWRSLSHLEWYFAVPVFASEGASYVCLWQLDRIALGTRGWFAVACAQLAGNAVGRFVPGAPTPFTVEMLRRAGVDTGKAAAAFASDRPLELAGRGIQWLLNTTVRRRHPVVGLPRELLADRDFIRTTLGGRWKAGVAAAGSRGQSATVTGRARLHRRRAAGAAAVHAWRPGLRRGGAGGDGHGGWRARVRRPGRDAAVPAGRLLAADSRRRVAYLLFRHRHH